MTSQENLPITEFLDKLTSYILDGETGRTGISSENMDKIILPQVRTIELQSQERIRKEALEECVNVLEAMKESEEYGYLSEDETIHSAISRIKSII